MMHDMHVDNQLGRAAGNQVTTIMSVNINIMALSRFINTVVKQSLNIATIKAFEKAIDPAASAALS